jgi:hypothetical protein
MDDVHKKGVTMRAAVETAVLAGVVGYSIIWWVTR